jgi:hypothetical protein
MPGETQQELREQVRARYARAARTVLDHGRRATDGCGAADASEQCRGQGDQDEASCFGAPPGMHAAVIRAVKPPVG